MFGLPALVVTLLFGALAGWLASLIAGGSGGVIRNVLVGLVGAMVGHLLFGAIGIRFGGPFLHSLAAAVFGGVVVIIAGRFLSK
jgi:uncharacterized membrane protein YeaQ/YmgE (transglycosylase-associated protein family)